MRNRFALVELAEVEDGGGGGALVERRLRQAQLEHQRLLTHAPPLRPATAHSAAALHPLPVPVLPSPSLLPSATASVRDPASSPATTALPSPGPCAVLPPPPSSDPWRPLLCSPPKSRGAQVIPCLDFFSTRLTTLVCFQFSDNAMDKRYHPLAKLDG